MVFPISGAETPFWLPIVVAFLISSITSTGGVSGAFLLLPFQVSILGFTGPAVTPTNFLFNVIAIPTGVYRFAKEKRMIWPIVWVLLSSSFIGTFVGMYIRIKYLPDPRSFKIFVGIILFLFSLRLIIDIIKNSGRTKNVKPDSGSFQVTMQKHDLKAINFDFNNQNYSLKTFPLVIISLFVGIIGGIYGIGGGAIIAPILIVVYKLPVHAIAGVALLNTFISSVFGVLLYTIIAPLFSRSELAVTPDWLLGLFMGIGGFAGVYIGSRLQKYIPEKIIKVVIGSALIYISIRYLIVIFL
ncbi:MAG: sulfite exporter TauE/SafE family protein [candidate division Zixibacteria bacterium]|nr:sulfite exporter TauE/SafE family protein [candidate division Zixibacteria bacterium]